MKNNKQNFDIKEQLSLLPEQPGCYLMYDKDENIIYIGKAKVLKNRVKSYFQKKHDSPKLRVMVPQIKRFEYIITDSEIEALILESHLIKKHKPKYNVLLKDDKRFPWFLITDEKYPRIVITRKANKQKVNGKYFGPYTNTRAMYSTLDLLKKLFPLRQCKVPRFKDRPCIYYQMGKCLAPCQELISSEDYKKIVTQVELFLSGKQKILLKELKKKMEEYSNNQEYEKASRYRDSYLDVMQTIEKQKVVSENTNVNQDIINFENDNLNQIIVLLKVRDGRLIAKDDFEIKLEKIHTPQESIIMFIQQYYQMVESDIPKEILLPNEFSEFKNEIKLLEEWLTIKRNNKVKIIQPKLQKKQELVLLAKKNALFSFENFKVKELSKIKNDWNGIGSYIQEKLNLPKFPHTMECFDISHIQGTNTVASMVVFENGKPKKSEYKRFKLKTLVDGKPDDFASMKEVIKRRYSSLLRASKDFPDLIIVDGGKGQLSSAIESLDEIGIEEQPIVSLAKKFEEIFVPEKSRPVIFPINSTALHVFQNIRDEAHRFAITYHRRLREKDAVKSILDEIEGISLKRKKMLFDYFKNIEEIKKANESELSRVVGKVYGKKVYAFFHKK